MKKPIIICVDDEKFFLTSIKNEISRIFENKITIEIAESGEEALDLINELINEHVEIPIIISDYMMPGMYGDEFLIKAYQLLPNTRQVLLTGQATLDGVKNVVNQSNLYRYIVKPWESTDLKLTISEAFRSYYKDKVIESQNKNLSDYKANIDKKINEKINHVKQEYESRLHDLINSFGNLIQLTTKSIVHLVNLSSENDNLKRIERLMKYVNYITQNLNPNKALKVELAVVISQAYTFLLEKDLTDRISIDKISAVDRKAIAKARLIVYNMFKNIPFLSEVVELVNYNYNFLDGTDEDLSHETLPTQEVISIVKIVIEYEKLISTGTDPKTAIATLILRYSDYKEQIKCLLGKKIIDKSESKINFNFDVNQFIEPSATPLNFETYNIKFSELKSGMTLVSDLEDIDGVILIPAGQIIAEDSILALMKYKHHKKIKEPIRVY